jgi:hypothetical protein
MISATTTPAHHGWCLPKLNCIDPQAWLADAIARISDMPVSRLPELLPWAWNAATPQVKAA